MYLTDPSTYGEGDEDGLNRSGIGNFEIHSENVIMRQELIMSYLSTKWWWLDETR